MPVLQEKKKKGQNKGREGERKLVFVMNWINGIIKLLFHHYRGKHREHCVYDLYVFVVYQA